MGWWSGRRRLAVLVLCAGSWACGQTDKASSSAPLPNSGAGQGGELPEPMPGRAGAGAANEGGGGMAEMGAGGTGGTGGSDPSGGRMGGTGGGVNCTSFRDADAPAGVSVHIVNETSGVIYLGQKAINCVAEPLFQVHDQDGMELFPPGPCRSCQDVMSGSYACFANCPWTPAVTLQPGEALDQAWTGLFGVGVQELPRACLSAPLPLEAATSCSYAAAAQPGKFTFSAKAGTAMECGAPEASTCGACQPNANGGCITIQGVVPLPTLSVETTLTLNAEDVVSGQHPALAELVFKD